MRTRLTLIPALAVAAVLALAGCAPGTTDTGTPDGTSSEAPSETDGGAAGTVGECLLGTWEIDGQRNAEQLVESFAANGSAITEAAAAGTVTLTVDASTMTYDSDITYTMSGDLGGLELIVEQNQAGVSSGSWTEADGEVTFSDWNQGIVVSNTVTVGGTASEFPLELPQDTGAGVPMAVTCSGDSLETTPDASPFTGYWSRVG